MIEHEHKFLLKPEVANVLQGKYEVVYSIDRRYLIVADGAEVRIWQRNGQDVLSLKFDTDCPEKRTEIDINVDLATGTELIQLAKHRLTKRRYECQGWEIDIFTSLPSPLALAEYELKPGETLPDFPAWLKPYVIAEVTHDLRYRNSNLAKRGLQT